MDGEKDDQLITTTPDIGNAVASHGEKLNLIHQACDGRDHQAIRDLATSEAGLVNDEARRVAWPLLLGSSDSIAIPKENWKELPRHRDEDQVQLDVNRSFVYYPANESKKQIEVRKQELSDVITSVLRSHPLLCYFQGYHDIVQVVLLVLGVDAAQQAVARLSLLRIRDFMLPTLAGAELHLHLIPPILYAADAELYRHLSGAARPTPFFALAATLTLYAHDIEEYGNIARLFDFLLASEAAVPLYLYVAIVLSRKDELLEIEPEDSDMLHFTLSKLPKPLRLESLIRRAVELFEEHPPQRLPKRTWSQISDASVLKTTRDSHALVEQTLDYGERSFRRQVTEVEQEEKRKRMRQHVQKLMHRYRRPAGWTGVAVVVAVIALYLGRRDDTSAVQWLITNSLTYCRRVYSMLPSNWR